MNKLPQPLMDFVAALSVLTERGWLIHLPPSSYVMSKDGYGVRLDGIEKMKPTHEA